MSEIIPESALSHRIIIEATDPQIIQTFLKSNTQQVVSAAPFYSLPSATPHPQSVPYVPQSQEFQKLHPATIPLAGFLLLGMTLLATPQGNKTWDSLPAIKSWQQALVGKQDKIPDKQSKSVTTKEDLIFPIAGYSGQTKLAGSIPGDCRPLGSCQYKHAGADYGAAPGTPVLSIEDGEINELKPDSGVGGVIGIKTDGVNEVYRYVHLNRDFLRRFKVGQKVKKGQVIGLIGPTFPGSSAPHLHLERYYGFKLDWLVHKRFEKAVQAK